MEEPNYNEFKDKSHKLLCCGQSMMIEYAGTSLHDFPMSYKCNKCGAFVIAYKYANQREKWAKERIFDDIEKKFKATGVDKWYFSIINQDYQDIKKKHL